MTLRCVAIAQAAGLAGERQSGKETMFPCPRHVDKHPSLAVNPEKNCWMCGPCGESGNAWELAAFVSGHKPDDRKAVASWLRERGLLSSGNGWEHVRDYVYQDESGAPLFRVRRYQTPTGKTFLQERFDGGGWRGGAGCMQGVKLVPYRLPEWKDAQTVCVVEGEKDADNLWALGIPATCSPGGAGKWRAEFNSLFAGKEAAVFPDNDEPGRRHANDVARNLLTTANSVKIVNLPGLPDKGDVSDWINAGGSRDELIQLMRQAPPAAREATEVLPPTAGAEPLAANWPSLSADALHGLPGDIVRAIDPFTEADPASQVYQLFTAPGIGTTFRLPEGVKIVDFVVTDSKNFHAESNGTIGIVTPLAVGKNTSVSIFTDDDRLFVFNLSSEPRNEVDQLVVVKAANNQLFSQRVQSDARKIAQERVAAVEARCDADIEQKTEQIRKQLLFSINSNYRITGNLFSIDKVSDDGIFTYVRLARSQERPVVYFGDAGNLRKLEPVRYTDEGDHYVIHRVLGPEDKGFVLKLGERVSEIRRNR